MEQEQKRVTSEDDDVTAGKGGVSDDAMDAVGKGVNAIQQQGEGGGKDRSTEDYAEQMPTEGVGAIQDSSLIKEDVARIEDEEGEE